MKKKKRTWILWLLLALLAAGLAVLPTVAARQAKASGANMEVRSLSPEYRSIDTQILGGGQLISKGVFDLEIPAKVKLTRFLVTNGDTVTEGTPIAEVDSVSVMTAIAGVQDTLTELSKQINAKATSSADSYLKAAAAGRVKKIYARPGDSVQDVMLAHGCLAVLSLDNTMQVVLETEENFTPGYKLNVIISGSGTVTGRVKSCVEGKLTVTLEDDHYALGTQAVLSKKDGTLIGTGSLEVASPWNLTAYDGTVTYVSMTEESQIYAGQSLLTVRVEGHSAEYQSLVDKHRKYEDLMRELVQLRDQGVITAPCDGIISGVDNNAAFLLCDQLPADTQEAPRLQYLVTFIPDPDWKPQLALLSDGGGSNDGGDGGGDGGGADKPGGSDGSDPGKEDPAPSGDGIIVITPPKGTKDRDYATKLTAKKDGASVNAENWEYASGELPPELKLDPDGGLSGKLTQAGTYTFSVTFTVDGETVQPQTVTLVVETEAKYEGYYARVNDVYGVTMNIDKQDTPIPINDLGELLTMSFLPMDSVVMNVHSVPANGPAVKSADLSLGDFIFVIYPAGNHDIPAYVHKLGSSNLPTTGTKPGTGMGGLSGLAGLFGGLGGGRSGLSGYGGMVPEDDGLYGLGKTVIATVTSQEHMSVSVVVDELDITSIYVGQKASVTMNSFAGEKLEAVITSIGNSGTNAGGSSKFTVEMELSRTSNMLPGMNITAVITLATEEHALCIPAEALYQKGGRSFVYTAKNAKTGELSNPVDVTLGKADADYVQILSGLDESSVIYYEHYEPQPEIPGPPQAM